MPGTIVLLSPLSTLFLEPNPINTINFSFHSLFCCQTCQLNNKDVDFILHSYCVAEQVQFEENNH